MLGPPVSQVEQKSGWLWRWSDKEGAGLVWAEVRGGEEGTRLWKVPGERAGAWCMVRGGQAGPRFMAWVTRAPGPIPEREPREARNCREFILGRYAEAADSRVRGRGPGWAHRLGVTE